jgi:hypothetical protein
LTAPGWNYLLAAFWEWENFAKWQPSAFRQSKTFRKMFVHSCHDSDDHGAML